jgi:hypothetical protein
MKKLIIALALFFGIIQACKSPTDKNSEISPFLENSQTGVSEDGLIEIGNKKEDPHVMRNMEKALKELAKAIGIINHLLLVFHLLSHLHDTILPIL